MKSTTKELEPLFVTAFTGARLLDMTIGEFKSLVAAGVLPPPRIIGPFERYDVEDIKTAIRRDKSGDDRMNWP